MNRSRSELFDVLMKYSRRWSARSCMGNKSSAAPGAVERGITVVTRVH